MPTLHVVGAGVAGLSAATSAAEAGWRVAIYEQASHGGGRCRSFEDTTLGRMIDNGNHLLLSGNTAVRRYIARIGAARALVPTDAARFHFADLESGERWALDLGDGRLPAWVFSPRRRVPGTNVLDYLSVFSALNASPESTIEQELGDRGAVYERFWKPLSVAVLNTEPSAAQARLLAPVIRETVGRGGAACRPMLAPDGLGAAFVDPALRYLQVKQARIAFSARLKAIEFQSGEPSVLRFADQDVTPEPGDRVVLALPAWSVAELLPGVTVPDEHRSILNGHFVLAGGTASRVENQTFVGLFGGLAEWLFVRDGVASVTVSAADAHIDRPAAELAAELWRDVARYLGIDGDALPPHRILKERRATFAQTPDQARRRPAAWSAPGGILLAGDWTDTGLPATVEGAIRSGETAARLAVTHA